MYVVTGRQEDLPDGLYTKVANYRHKVFVEQLGWQLQTIDNAEQTNSIVATRSTLQRATSRAIFPGVPACCLPRNLSSWRRFSTAPQRNATQFTRCLGIIAFCRRGF